MPARRVRSRTTVRRKAIEELATSEEMIRLLVQVSDPVHARMRVLAPISATGSHGRRPGYLRTRIVMRVKTTVDPDGNLRKARIELHSTARTRDGFPYGAEMNRRREYMKAALGL